MEPFHGPYEFLHTTGVFIEPMLPLVSRDCSDGTFGDLSTDNANVFVNLCSHSDERSLGAFLAWKDNAHGVSSSP